MTADTGKGTHPSWIQGPVPIHTKLVLVLALGQVHDGHEVAVAGIGRNKARLYEEILVLSVKHVIHGVNANPF